MAMILQVLPTVLPVIAALIIGMVLRRTGIVSREGITGMKAVVSNVTLPAMLIGVFAKVQYTPNTLLQTGLVFVMCILAVFVGRVLSKPLKLQSPFAALCCTGFEGGMIGYALITLLYGAGNVAEFAVLDLGGGLFINTVFRVMLNRVSSTKSTGKEIAKSVLTSPVTLCILLGVLMGATGLYARLPSWGLDTMFDGVIDFIGAPTSTVILLCIGYDLSLEEFKKPACVKTLILRLVTLGLLLCAAIPCLKFVLHGSDLSVKSLVLLCLLPTSFMLPVYSDEPEERSYISGVISVSTIFTIAAFAVLALTGF